jgi:Leucine-rich repeat (LRR) protein
MNGCKISKLPENLEGLKNLRSLQLSGCPIEKKEMERIRAVLVKTAIVF